MSSSVIQIAGTPASIFTAWQTLKKSTSDTAASAGQGDSKRGDGQR